MFVTDVVWVLQKVSLLLRGWVQVSHCCLLVFAARVREYMEDCGIEEAR